MPPSAVFVPPTNPATRSIYEDIEDGELLISPNVARTMAPFAIDGKRGDICTVYRACQKGRIAADGLRVRLEFVIAKGGRYRQLYDKQYRFERDRFVNPGEDFTPEPAVVTGPVRTSTTLLIGGTVQSRSR